MPRESRGETEQDAAKESWNGNRLGVWSSVSDLRTSQKNSAHAKIEVNFFVAQRLQAEEQAMAKN